MQVLKSTCLFICLSITAFKTWVDSSCFVSRVLNNGEDAAYIAGMSLTLSKLLDLFSLSLSLVFFVQFFVLDKAETQHFRDEINTHSSWLKTFPTTLWPMHTRVIAPRFSHPAAVHHAWIRRDATAEVVTSSLGKVPLVAVQLKTDVHGNAVFAPSWPSRPAVPADLPWQQFQCEQKRFCFGHVCCCEKGEVSYLFLGLRQKNKMEVVLEGRW